MQRGKRQRKKRGRDAEMGETEEKRGSERSRDGRDRGKERE
jgi:hypothetical protein